MSIAAQQSSHNESGVTDIGGSLHYYSGCEFPFFNGVFNNYKHDKLAINDNLDPVIDFYNAKNRPFIWWWTEPAEIPEDIQADLNSKGFHFLGDFLGVAAKLDEIKFAPINNKIETGEVTTPKEYEIFLTIMCDVFQMSESIKADLREMYNAYGPAGKFKHYIGYYAGEPVSTLTAYIDGALVGLYNGATLPQFQKNGLCGALAHTAIKDAMALKCEYAVSQLMATAMAKGLSEQMGSKTYCLLRPFLKEPQKNTISRI